MAIRQHQDSSFAGGVSRWVSAEEARRFGRQLASLETFGDFADWLEAAPEDVQSAMGVWGIRARRAGRDALLASEPASERLAETLISGLAAVRRDNAVRAYATEHGLDPYVALGARDPRHSLCRCPRCDAPSNEDGLYCAGCREIEQADLDKLLGRR